LSVDQCSGSPVLTADSVTTATDIQLC